MVCFVSFLSLVDFQFSISTIETASDLDFPGFLEQNQNPAP